MEVTDAAALDAVELLAAFASGALTPLQALQGVTERIARRNPEINAFAAMNPQALAAARESAARWRAGAARPLEGVPVTVKDLIDVRGLPTRRGSRATVAEPAARDAPLVAALRRAGAVITGKTATTEFGWKSPGDNPLGGITRNPWNPAHTPGGSSAGAAAAAAAFFGPLHVGTDGGGSIRIPAAWSGVVGLKPSFGRVPQWPLGAFAPLAVAGPLTRSVADAALLLSALAGFDRADPFSLPEPPLDFSAGLEAGAAGLKIGILRQPGFAAPATRAAWAAVEEAAALLAQAGAEIGEAAPDLPDAGRVFSVFWGAGLARTVFAVPPERRGLIEPGLRALAARFRDTMALDLLEAEAARVQAAHAMAALEFDALLCPAVPASAPLVDAVWDDPVAALTRDWAPWTVLFSLTRQPALSLPMGVDEAGLPVAVQIAAPLYRDDTVLRVARAVERELG
ncbi:amidase family protein [Acidocella sp.]|uniref:amidase family protein n=1 Tax=Acidocella sp. TaxID=50710 RepID=UPI00262794F8|nr:amidase family protein [Acidocella sp.]